MTISRLYFHGIDVCKLLTMNATLLVSSVGKFCFLLN